mmetsp:Transcript_9167/g.9236  ORF Transcript_9167/g.9236 Transcript_9167/m.9236 type:complete len:260 (-) Transcript_9167:42-821(-)|eukprot:CAMPEP_0182427984 /NCGR_PEP_ID=MMETSP1167-20130531/20918_1 /TAXON_ID=2988 /ORGANISM="Mallomonas Sp, Strain CCMP3275" /LENGTH=259 /DNA_ID=CAMNT_0024610597 /DNA_START=56 /DNA_END=835 /DNA_ORIENTATION=-
MKFRPCIDLHNGVAKQIVGSTLSEDAGSAPVENFTSSLPTSYYANLYKEDDLSGGHIIMLGPNNESAAKEALSTYPTGFQIGGGITLSNAEEYLSAGASHIIVTSYVFQDGVIQFDRLQALRDLVGRERLVLDLSCRRHPHSPTGEYYVVTNKWTKYTDFAINRENLSLLSTYCAEFLVHAVDVEGKQRGVEGDLIRLLGDISSIPVVYAGGVRSLEDLDLVQTLGQGKVDCTVGSALDIFGGSLPYRDVVAWHKAQQS